MAISDRWITFGLFMVTMVGAGISFAYFTVGKGDDIWLSVVSILALEAVSPWIEIDINYEKRLPSLPHH